LQKTGYFNPLKTRNLVNRFIKDDHFVESETQNMALIGILSTQILHEQYIENFYAQSVQPVAVDKIIDRRKAKT
jgi:asparagine synthase (glutamine-hydrolysing)